MRLGGLAVIVLSLAFLLRGTVWADLPVSSTATNGKRPSIINQSNSGLIPWSRNTSPPNESLVLRNVELAPDTIAIHADGPLPSIRKVAGHFAGFTNGVIAWQHPAATEPLQIRSDWVHYLSLPHPNPPTTSPAPRWLLFLTNGDLMTGDDLRVDESHVEVTSSALGRVRFIRNRLMSLRRCPTDGTRRNELVRLGADSRLIKPYGKESEFFYREVALPEVFLAEMFIPKTELPAQFWLGVGALPQPFADAHFRLTIRDRLVRLERLPPKTAALQDFDPLTPLPADTGPILRLAVVIHRKSNGAALYCNGKLLRQIEPLQAQPLPDSGIAALPAEASRTYVSPLLISEMPPDLILPEPAADADNIRLANFDQVKGRLIAIHSNTVVIAGTFGRTELPLDRLAAIDLLAGPAPAAGPAAAKCVLTSGESVHGRIEHFDDRTMRLTDTVAGTITLERRLVQEIGFPGTPQVPLRPPLTSRDEIPAQLALTNPIAAPPGGLSLLTGEIWTGDLISMSNGLVRWAAPECQAPIQFHQSAVRALSLRRSQLPRAPTQSPVTVSLRNGDHWAGQFDALGADRLRFQPWGMAPVEIPKAHLSALQFHPADPNTITTGPDAQWQADTGPLAPGAAPAPSASMVCRTLPIPDRFKLRFEATFAPGNLNLFAYLYLKTDAATETAFECYRLYISHQGTMLAVLPAVPEEAADAMTVPDGSAVLSALKHKGHATFTLFVDRARRELSLWADGQLVRQFLIPSPRRPAGDKILLWQRSSPHNQFRNITISRWPDGAPATAADAGAPPEGDSIRFNDNRWQPTAKDSTAATIILRDGSRLTLAVQSVSEQNLTGVSPITGGIVIPRHLIATVVLPEPSRPALPPRRPRR